MPSSFVAIGAITLTSWARHATFTRSECRISELARPPTSSASSRLYGSSSRCGCGLPCPFAKSPPRARYHTFHSSNESHSCLPGALLCAHRVAYRCYLLDLPVHRQVHRHSRSGCHDWSPRYFPSSGAGNSVHHVVAFFEHCAVPLDIRRHERPARSARDQLDRWIDCAHLPRRVRRFQAILARRHVPDLPRAVHLIAHAPELHAVRLCVTVRSAVVRSTSCPWLRCNTPPAPPHPPPTRYRNSGRAAAPFPPAGPGDEFICAELVCLQCVPRAIQHRRSFVFRTYAVQPVIARHEIPARPANNRDTQLAHFLASRRSGIRSLSANFDPGS